MSQAVICLVPSEVEANRIVTALQSAGFRNDSISALFPDKNTTKDMGHEKHSKAPEGTATGAGAGALVGGALGLLAGIGVLAIPGAGPFIAAGPIMAMMSGAALGTGVGGVAGGLIGLGIPEYEAKQYEGKIREGNILLSVHTESGDEAKRAEDIFKANGARDVKRVSEEKVEVKGSSDRGEVHPLLYLYKEENVMGIWKFGFAILFAVMLTEKGRETVRKLAKEALKTGQSVIENGSCAAENLKTEASKLIEEIKVEEKEKKQEIRSKY